MRLDNPGYGRFVGEHDSPDGFELMVSTDAAAVTGVARPTGRTVVLGLVTSKSPVLEPGDELQRRVDSAAGLVDLDHLALSPQCGFASVAEGGNLLTEDEQFAKLRLVADTARAIWGDG